MFVHGNELQLWVWAQKAPVHGIHLQLWVIGSHTMTSK